MTAPPQRDQLGSPGVPREGESLRGARARADYVIDHATGCWEWQKAKLRGYGNFGNTKAHRAYYERAYGPVLTDHDVHHLCHNPGCVNPDHLEAVPGLEHRKAHRLAAAGVTFDDYREMRRRYWEEAASPAALAEEYGVHRRSVWQAARGRKWAEELGSYTPPVRICALVGCEEEIGVDRRNDATFCTKYHQSLHNQRKRRLERKAA